MTRPLFSILPPSARIAIWVVTLGLAFVLVAPAMSAAAQSGDQMTANSWDRPTITVTGQGRASATPDMATFTTGVEVSADTLSSAQEEATSRMETVLDALRQAGVPDDAIQTVTYRVEVIRSDTSPPQPVDTAVASDASATMPATPGPVAPLGFRVINDVRVEVRDIARLGSLLDAVVVAGANQVSGISLTVADPSTAERQAREQAIAAARTTAEDLAQAAGGQLGDVLLIVADNASSSPVFVARAQAADAAVPIEPGQNEIATTVQVTFALLPGDEIVEATPSP